MLRAVLVDDEPLARERLKTMLASYAKKVDVVGEAGDGKSALSLIHDLQPDVVFLDVQMPVLDGFDVLDRLVPPKPYVIFVTAYDEYAIRAFEVHALDYLTKPVRRERLYTSLQRVEASLTLKIPDQALEALQHSRASNPLTRLTLRFGRRLRIINLSDVRYLESEDKFVFVHLDGVRYPTDFTLKNLENRLDPDLFLRIHRAYIVNINAVHELVPWFSSTYQLKLDDGTQLPVARRRLRAVKACLGNA